MIILGTNSIKDTGYNVANSLRFNQPSSDYLNRTPSSAGNQRTFTVSFWYKRTNFGAKDIIMSTTNGGSTFFNFGFIGSGTYANKFQFYWYDGSTDYGYHSARLFRDTSAWYHVVLAVDTTQGTESNRAKVYINGVQETLTATYGAFPQNLDTYFNKNNVHYIGYDHDSSGALLNGYLSEVVNIDGSQLAPTSFGEFDEDSGIWKPIDVSGLTFGTNGFYLDFENSGALGNDAAGSNNFTVNNLTAIDQSTDTCTNNFATINSLDNFYAQATFSNGNLTVVTPVSQYAYIRSTIAASSGKWYAELKITTASAADNQHGIVSDAAINSTGGVGERANAYGYRGSGQVVSGGSVVSYSAASYTAGDIISIAMDLDNNLIFFYKNGAIQNSGTGLAITAPASTTDGVYYFATSDNANLGGGTYQFDWNFGSPPFAISSGNTDGNGYGNFEYAVPSGYYSLNTKNLAEFG